LNLQRLNLQRFQVLFLLIVVIQFLTFCKRDQQFSFSVEEIVLIDSLEEIKELTELDEYGFPVGNVSVNTSTVKRNESLYLILEKLDVSRKQIWEIQKTASQIFDPSRIKPGQKYVTYSKPGISENTFRLIYHPDPVNYYVIDWQNELVVEAGKKRVEINLRFAEGIIESSLYESLAKKNVTPLLANELSNVFAWQIDFFRLYPGDSYRVIFEEKFSGGEYLGLGKILAAEFVHQNENYKAFFYKDQNHTGYYDENGKSVQKALLKAPFKFSQRISSGFSHNRFHPVLKRRMPHYGVDYAAPRGTPVISVGDGQVIEARYRGANGNIVKIRHNGTYTTAYLHLQGFARGIKKGAEVKQGQVIGYVGKTGRVTGVHLDYRIYKNNRPVNPLTIKLPPSRSIDAQSVSNFMAQREKLWNKLTNSASSLKKEPFLRQSSY